MSRFVVRLAGATFFGGLIGALWTLRALLGGTGTGLDAPYVVDAAEAWLQRLAQSDLQSQTALACAVGVTASVLLLLLWAWSWTRGAGERRVWLLVPALVCGVPLVWTLQDCPLARWPYTWFSGVCWPYVHLLLPVLSVLTVAWACRCSRAAVGLAVLGCILGLVPLLVVLVAVPWVFWRGPQSGHRTVPALGLLGCMATLYLPVSTLGGQSYAEGCLTMWPWLESMAFFTALGALVGSLMPTVARALESGRRPHWVPVAVQLGALAAMLCSAWATTVAAPRNLEARLGLRPLPCPAQTLVLPDGAGGVTVYREGGQPALMGPANAAVVRQALPSLHGAQAEAAVAFLVQSARRAWDVPGVLQAMALKCGGRFATQRRWWSTWQMLDSVNRTRFRAQVDTLAADMPADASPVSCMDMALMETAVQQPEASQTWYDRAVEAGASPATSHAWLSRNAPKESGCVRGRVWLDGRPVAGVGVRLVPALAPDVPLDGRRLEDIVVSYTRASAEGSLCLRGDTWEAGTEWGFANVCWTDAEGRFEFDGVKAQTYGLMARLTGNWAVQAQGWPQVLKLTADESLDLGVLALRLRSDTTLQLP